MELHYQALPCDSGFVELVRDIAQRAPAHRQAVCFTPFFLKHGKRGVLPAPGREKDNDWPDAQEIWNWCCSALGRYPDLAERQFYIGKRVDKWRFLFSAPHRRETRWPRPHPTDERAWNDPTSEFDKLIELAFLGAPQIAPDVVASQGCPVQFIEPAQTADLGLCLGAMEMAEIAPHLNELMGSDEPSSHRDVWLQNIAGFITFWQKAAERGDGVLVVYD